MTIVKNRMFGVRSKLFFCSKTMLDCGNISTDFCSVMPAVVLAGHSLFMWILQSLWTQHLHPHTHPRRWTAAASMSVGPPLRLLQWVLVNKALTSLSSISRQEREARVKRPEESRRRHPDHQQALQDPGQDLRFHASGRPSCYRSGLLHYILVAVDDLMIAFDQCLLWLKERSAVQNCLQLKAALT